VWQLTAAGRQLPRYQPPPREQPHPFIAGRERKQRGGKRLGLRITLFIAGRARTHGDQGSRCVQEREGKRLGLRSRRLRSRERQRLLPEMDVAAAMGNTGRLR
jgi:hypothetical protein